ncbi:citrate lyase subunit gamma [Euryarchaeota archaeon ex4484_178]|nr:MAG: citrate lyase subunit gamma [Euryarchaeota archaeon ex4484_178]
MIEAGTREKGDVFVTIEDIDERRIIVKSKLERLYGDAIRATVEELTRELNAKIVVEDFGALDWVLRARLEAAIRKYRGEGI